MIADIPFANAQNQMFQQGQFRQLPIAEKLFYELDIAVTG